MIKLTPAQHARAVSLIREEAKLDMANKQLAHVLDTMTAASTANHAAREAVTNFDDPNRLGGAAELRQRTDARTAMVIDARYRWLIGAITDPVMGNLPKRIDLNALKPDARPYLLPIYLDLNPKHTALDLLTSQPQRGHLVYTSTSGPIDVDAWRARIPAIDQWLGDTWAITAHAATKLTLTRRKPLPATLPLNRAWLKDGAILLGIDVDTHQPVHLPLHGMTHSLLTGTTGVGKSTFIHLLLTGCLHSADHFERIYCICGQNVAFERYRHHHPKLTVLSEAAELFKLTGELVTTMKARTERMVAGGSDVSAEPFILLLVDEFPAFNDPEDTDRKSDAFKAHAAFMRDLIALGRRARKANIRLWLCTQDPTKESLDTTIRSVLPSVAAFQLNIQQHASAVFGTIPEGAADPRFLPRGEMLFLNGLAGTRHHLKIPLVTPPAKRPAP